MGLSSQIVIRNEFTNTQNASRGASPGNYIVNYTARDDAAEKLAPVGVNNASLDQYIAFYSTRHKLTNQAKSEFAGKNELKKALFLLDGRDGRGFGSLGLSYRYEELEEEAEQIQDCFDKGHTIQKTIISFTTDYLIKLKVLPADFKHKEKGDFAGKLDQLKLRRAIIKGVNKFTELAKFAKPIWVGTIQTDTHHVHAHLTIADKVFSKVRKFIDGTEKGKITKHEREGMRRGIHRSLQSDKGFAHYHSGIENAKQESVANVRSLTVQQMNTSVQLQQLIAALPVDEEEWVYNSDSKSMTRANHLMNTYLTSLDTEHGDITGVKKLEAELEKFAEDSLGAEEGTETTKVQFVEFGRQMAMERMGNGVYAEIKEHFMKERRKKRNPTPVKTPLLEIGAKDTSELIGLAKKKPEVLTLVQLRFQMFSERKMKHLSEGLNFHGAYREFGEALLNKQVAEESLPIGRFYKNEMVTHFELVDKYRAYLPVRTESSGEETHELSGLREHLEIQQKNLNEILMKKSETPQLSLNKAIEEFQNDANVQSLLMAAGETKDSEGHCRTVSEVLDDLKKDGTMPIPLNTQLVLNKLKQKKYADLGANIEIWQNNLNGDKELPPKFQKDLNSHMKEVDTYTLKGFLSGKFHATDIQPIQKQFVHQQNTGELLPLPEEKPVDNLMKSNTAYQKRINALDIDEVVNDFNPLTDRSVGSKARGVYKERLNEREESLIDALEYIQKTNQPVAPLLQIQQQIQQKQRFARKLEEDKKLPISIDEAVIEDKLNASIHLDYSRELTEKNLMDIRKIREETLIEIKTNIAPVTVENEVEKDESNSQLDR